MEEITRIVLTVEQIYKHLIPIFDDSKQSDDQISSNSSSIKKLLQNEFSVDGLLSTFYRQAQEGAQIDLIQFTKAITSMICVT